MAENSIYLSKLDAAKCLSQWNTKIASMDPMNYPRPSQYNLDANLIVQKYSAEERKLMKENNQGYIIENYISLSQYSDLDVNELQMIVNNIDELINIVTRFVGQPSRSTMDQQRELLNEIRTATSSVIFKKLKYGLTGREALFLDFPLRNFHTNAYMPNYSSMFGYDSWRHDIPELIIERLNCYLNYFNDLIDYKNYINRPGPGPGGAKKYKMIRKSNKKRNNRNSKKYVRKNSMKRIKKRIASQKR